MCRLGHSLRCLPPPQCCRCTRCRAGICILKAAQYLSDSNPFSNSMHADSLLEFYPNLERSHVHKATLTSHKERNVPVWRGSFSGWDPTPRYPKGNAPKGMVKVWHVHLCVCLAYSLTCVPCRRRSQSHCTSFRVGNTRAHAGCSVRICWRTHPILYFCLERMGRR